MNYEFKECDVCAAKPGSPELCWGCLHNRSVIENLTSGWSAADLDDLDRKFDALCEFLQVEFVFEKISDGSEWADTERWYVRKKKNRPK